MALVDMVLADPDLLCREHPGPPADPEHDRLFEPVLLVAAVEAIGYPPPVIRRVLREVGIEEEDRHEAANRAPVVVDPGPDRDVRIPPDPHRHPLGEFPHVPPRGSHSSGRST